MKECVAPPPPPSLVIPQVVANDTKLLVRCLCSDYILMQILFQTPLSASSVITNSNVYLLKILKPSIYKIDEKRFPKFVMPMKLYICAVQFNNII